MSLTIYKGYLIKSPPPKKVSGLSRFLPKARWRRRFFVLSQSIGCLPRLEYFEDESKKKLKGKIDLSSIDSIESRLQSKTYDFVFSLSTAYRNTSRTYYLASSSERDMNSWVDYLCKMCQCVSVEDDEVDSNPRRKHRMTPRSESPTFIDLPPTKSFSPVGPPVLLSDNSRDSIDESKDVYDVIWPAVSSPQPINGPPRLLQRQDSVPSEPAPVPPVKNSPVTSEQNYVNITPPADGVNMGDFNHNTSSVVNRCVPPPPPTKVGPNGYYNQVLDDDHYDFPSMNTHVPPAKIGLQQVHAYENGSMGLVPPVVPKEPSSGILTCQVPKEPIDPKLKYVELSTGSEDKSDFRPKAFRDLPLRNSNTRSFKRERTEEDRIRLHRRKPTEEYSDDEVDIDNHDNINEDTFSNGSKPKTPTSPSNLSNKGILVPPNLSAANVRVPAPIQNHKMVNYSELSLELPSTPSSPKKSVPATEYREIDFEKTTALRSVITKKPTQQSE